MKQFLVCLCIICILIPIAAYGGGIIKAVTMDVNCIDFLELAADANSVDLAEKYLTKGIEYLEANNLTSGFTKIIVYKPTNDIGFWYENLKSAQTQLQELSQKEDLTELEESNALMKLRETLLDSEGSVTHPQMISYYPNGAFWFWYMALIWLLWGVALAAGSIAYESY